MTFIKQTLKHDTCNLKKDLNLHYHHHGEKMTNTVFECLSNMFVKPISIVLKHEIKIFKDFQTNDNQR